MNNNNIRLIPKKYCHLAGIRNTSKSENYRERHKTAEIIVENARVKKLLESHLKGMKK